MDVTETRLTGVLRKERQPLTLNPSPLSSFTNSWASSRPAGRGGKWTPAIVSDRLPVVFGVDFRAIIGSVIVAVIRLEPQEQDRGRLPFHRACGR